MHLLPSPKLLATSLKTRPIDSVSPNWLPGCHEVDEGHRQGFLGPNCFTPKDLNYSGCDFCEDLDCFVCSFAFPVEPPKRRGYQIQKRDEAPRLFQRFWVSGLKPSRPRLEESQVIFLFVGLCGVFTVKLGQPDAANLGSHWDHYMRRWCGRMCPFKMSCITN